MKKFLSFLLVLFCVLQSFFLTSCKKSSQKFTDYSFDYFDTVTTIIGYEEDQSVFKANCEKIKGWLKEYHQLYDIYNFYDGITNLYVMNQSQNKLLTVDKKIVDLLVYSKEIYSKNPQFNVAMGSVLTLWHNYRQYGSNHPESAVLPPEDALLKASKHTNFDDIIIDSNANTILIRDENLLLDVGAIAKGYAAEEVANKMISDGITGYLLNLGGNIKIVGKRSDNEKWKVGIENPDTDNTEEPYIEYLALANMSLVTSGSYQRFYIVNGKNYHHIIDPKTLYPAEYFKSVSVLCKNSALADAYSTLLFCLPYESGKQLVGQTDGLYVMWVTNDGNRLYSDGFKDFCYNDYSD